MLYDLTDLSDVAPDADLFQAIDISDTDLILCTERVEVGDPMKAFVLHPHPNDELRLTSFEPALAGEIDTLEINGATPNGIVYPVMSPPSKSQLCAEAVPGCPGLSVPFCHPRVVGRLRAGIEGHITWVRYIPPSEASRIYWLQAIEPTTCRSTAPAAIVLGAAP